MKSLPETNSYKGKLPVLQSSELFYLFLPPPKKVPFEISTKLCFSKNIILKKKRFNYEKYLFQHMSL